MRHLVWGKGGSTPYPHPLSLLSLHTRSLTHTFAGHQQRLTAASSAVDTRLLHPPLRRLQLTSRPQESFVSPRGPLLFRPFCRKSNSTDMMGKTERRRVNLKGLLRKNWLLIATVVSVVLGMWKPLNFCSFMQSE